MSDQALGTLGDGAAQYSLAPHPQHHHHDYDTSKQIIKIQRFNSNSHSNDFSQTNKMSRYARINNHTIGGGLCHGDSL